MNETEVTPAVDVLLASLSAWASVWADEYDTGDPDLFAENVVDYVLEELL